MNVIGAQKKAIETLKRAINGFLGNRNIKTRVVPLAIPTGWGKTRIAIQAILNADRKTAPLSVVIWPQKQSHMSKEVWKRCRDWCIKRTRTCELPNGIACKDNQIPEIKHINPSKRGPKEGRHGHGAYSHSKKFTGTFYYVNNRFDKGVISQLSKNKGPIIFVIDEWHSKKLLEKYQGYAKLESGDAEGFWRKELLGMESSRKLFVILISATPIGATSEMDDISNNDGDDNYEENIKKSLKAFKDLTSVGNQNREYDLYTIYPDIISTEEKKLQKVHDRYGYNGITSKDEWIKEYVKLSAKAYRNHNKKPNPPSLVYALESLLTSGVPRDIIRKQYSSLKKYFITGFSNPKVNLKLATMLRLLRKHSNRKFVIFCHYIAVARALKDCLDKESISSFYLEGDVKDSKVKSDTSSLGMTSCNLTEFEKFNKKEGKTRVLIVTDKHSQGVSLHESEAWLIHFELSWNPIRIIQRYGRVWRINHKTKELTSPAAFYIPHSFSSEEEIINRLQRRWKVLQNVSGTTDTNFVNLAPISFEVALGKRCSPRIS